MGNDVGDYCRFTWGSGGATACGQKAADYLAGYAEALADRCSDRHPDD